MLEKLTVSPEISDLPFYEILASVFVQLLISSLIAWLAIMARKAINRRGVHKIWGHVCDGRRRVTIVVPSIAFDSFRMKEFESNAFLPSNVTLVGLYDGIAVAEVIAGLKRAYPKCDFPLRAADNFSALDEPFVTIGGPSVNIITKRLLESHPDLDLEVIYPEHRAIDQRAPVLVLEPRYRADTTEIEVDYGLAVCLPNPYNPQTNAIAIFGTWTYGTYAAAYALSQPNRKLLSELGRLLKKPNWLLAVKANVVRLSCGSAAIVRGRPARRP